MEQVTTIRDLRNARARHPEPVGLIPTMGFLHDGHRSLVRYARKECASVVVSIFVNPTQFGANEDLNSYPRDLPHDLHLLKKEQVDLVWIPTPEIMYPEGYQTWVAVEEVARPLEGSNRPGHFKGVTTVVAKLFNAVKPNKAYFGQKDAQQTIVIKQMVRDLNFDIDIVVCPIVREPDGLAMSSRNTYLNREERQAATLLYQALKTAQTAYHAGEHNPDTLRHILAEVIQSEPLARAQYVSCANPKTLQELEKPIRGHALLSTAVYLGKIRLIDNLLIGE